MAKVTVAVLHAFDNQNTLNVQHIGAHNVHVFLKGLNLFNCVAKCEPFRRS